LRAMGIKTAKGLFPRGKATLAVFAPGQAGALLIRQEKVT
jgi:hypothetical protein